ncbi:MAG: FAD assembly factor SdhE [Wenzhouxiangella sp.]
MQAPLQESGVPKDVLWRCRRGMRELDVLLLRWLQACWNDSSTEVQDSFRALLACEDDQLWDWLLGRSRPGSKPLRELVDEIRSLPVVN